MRYQPQGLARIDQSNPITRGLIGAFLPGILYNVVDRVELATVSDAGVSMVEPRHGGLAIASGNYRYPRPLDGSSPEAKFDLAVLTALVVASQDSTSNLDRMLARANGSSAPHWGIGLHTGTYNGAAAVLGSFSYTPTDTAGRVLGRARVAIIRGDGATATVILDGATVASGAYTPPAYAYSAGRQVHFGPRSATNVEKPSAANLGLFWNRPLTDSEIASVTANPWQVFAAPEEDYEIAGPAGGAGYTLSAGFGVFALAGADGQLRAARISAMGLGAFALAGSAAAVRAERKLAANPGAIGLTGGSPSLLAARFIGAANGTVTLAGANAALAVLRSFAATTGAFVITGGGTQLVYAPTVAGPVFVSQAGLLLLSGGAAAMRVTRRLGLGFGTFASSPGEATIRFGGRIVADANPYLLDGSGAALRASWRLVAGAMTFSVSGYSLNLRLTGLDLPDSRIYRGSAERRIVRANPERRVHRERKQ